VEFERVFGKLSSGVLVPVIFGSVKRFQGSQKTSTMFRCFALIKTHSMNKFLAASAFINAT